MKHRSWNQNQRQLEVLLRNYDDPLNQKMNKINETKFADTIEKLRTDDNPKISSLTFSSLWCPIHGATAASAPPCCPLINASCSLLNSPKILYKRKIHFDLFRFADIRQSNLHYLWQFLLSLHQLYSRLNTKTIRNSLHPVLLSLLLWTIKIKQRKICRCFGRRQHLEIIYPSRLVQPFPLMGYQLLVILVLNQLLP